MLNHKVEIVYLTPINSDYNGKNTSVKVIKEEIGDILSLYRCDLYLKLFHGKYKWSIVEVSKCFNIFLTLVKRTGNWDEDLWYERFFTKHGVFVENKRKIAKKFFETSDITICCYKGAQWKSTKGEPLSLVNILRDDDAYKMFCDFWEGIPTFSQYQNVLLPYFPKDIVNKILCMVV